MKKIQYNILGINKKEGFVFSPSLQKVFRIFSSIKGCDYDTTLSKITSTKELPLFKYRETPLLLTFTPNEEGFTINLFIDSKTSVSWPIKRSGKLFSFIPYRFWGYKTVAGVSYKISPLIS